MSDTKFHSDVLQLLPFNGMLYLMHKTFIHIYFIFRSKSTFLHARTHARTHADTRTRTYLNIMRLLDVHFLGQNDVNLDEELVAEVEGGDGVDLFDVVIVV